MLLEHTGLVAKFEHTDLERAFWNIKHKALKLHDGTCFEAWYQLALAAPSEFLAMINTFVCSPEQVSTFVVRAKLSGKGTPNPKPAEIRAILPLPALMQIADWLVADAMATQLNESMAVPDYCYCGGGRGTQVCDIIAAISIALQKSSDSGCPCAVAQADIRAFYDRVDVTLIVKWLIWKRCPPWLRCAVLVLQMCSGIEFAHLDASLRLRPRARGTLTGSRVAGVCGQLVVRDVLAQVEKVVRPYELLSHHFQLATWVDNIYSLGGNPGEACQRLEVFGRYLAERWRLDIKPSSMIVYSDKKRYKGKDFGEYSWASPFTVLGCKVGTGGNPWSDFDQAELVIWKRFWMGAGSKVRKSLPLRARVRDLEIGCWPVLSFRCPWWSMGKCCIPSFAHFRGL